MMILYLFCLLDYFRFQAVRSDCVISPGIYSYRSIFLVCHVDITLTLYPLAASVVI